MKNKDIKFEERKRRRKYRSHHCEPIKIPFVSQNNTQRREKQTNKQTNKQANQTYIHKLYTYIYNDNRIS